MVNALSFGLPKRDDQMITPPLVTSPAPAPMQAPSRKNAMQMIAPRVDPPMRKASPRTSSSHNALSMFMPQQRTPNGLDAFVDTLQRVVDPAAAQAREARMSEEQKQKLTQGRAFVQQMKALPMAQQMKALPMAQRMAMARQGASQFGLGNAQFDPNAFTDEALNMSIATLSSHLGMAPEQPEYMNLGGGNVGMTRGGEFSMVREAPGEPVKPTVVNNRVLDPNDPTKVLADYSDQEPDQPEYTYENFDGAVWAVDKRDPNKRTRLGAAPQGTQANPPETYRSLSPDEVAARGYSPGTVVQVDSRGREYVNARPSTAQTGQPTEGERKFALYATSAQGALKDIDSIEFGKDYTDGVEPIWERGNQMNPFDEKSRKYDQAIDRFLDGWSRAMTGAAMTTDEKNFYYGIMKPTFGDSPAVRIQKAQTRHKMAADLAIAASRGMTPYNIRDAASQYTGAPSAPVDPNSMGAGGSSRAVSAVAQRAANASPQPMQVPPDAISDLMADPSPEAMAEFDEAFGEGAAARAMNGSR